MHSHHASRIDTSPKSDNDNKREPTRRNPELGVTTNPGNRSDLDDRFHRDGYPKPASAASSLWLSPLN